MRVLLMEDNPVDEQQIRSMIASFTDLEPAIDSCSTLSEAGDLLARNEYDIIVSDLHVHDAQGIPVVERLVFKAPTTPVVVLTGTYRDESMGLAALQKGAKDYLIKENLTPYHLRRAVQHAIERNELEKSHKEFLAMITHDLRAPAAAITSALEILEPDLRAGMVEKKLKFVDMIRQNCDRLIRFCSDIHAIAKADAGAFAIEHHPADLAEIIRHACRTARPAARDAGIELLAQGVEDGPIPTLGDAERIEQALNNLINNAVRFAEKQVRVIVESDAESHRIIVEDDGPGIRDKDMPKLFSKFYRGAQTARTLRGSGLGLTIVRMIAKAHGGSATAENRPAPANGARFIITLPAAATDANRRSILIVDNEEPIRRSLTVILRDEGFQVRGAESAAEALAKLAEQPADLVISDFVMPGMNGGELLDRIRDIHPGLPVIFFSGTFNAEQSAELIHRGASQFFQKPADFEKLTRACRDILTRPPQTAASR